MSGFTIDDFDADGALRETAARLPTRGRFLRLAAATALGGAGLGWLPGVASARPAYDDRAILNFALALEYLQAAFYTEAQQLGALHGGLARQARVVGGHERDHVRAFRSVLGSAAIPSPRFDFHGVTGSPSAFRATAVALEDLAVGAYKAQLPKISNPTYLATAISIHSVEARHAAWIRELAGIVPAPHAFDEPIDDAQTLKLVASTHFVSHEAARTSSDSAPRFTG